MAVPCNQKLTQSHRDQKWDSIKLTIDLVAPIKWVALSYKAMNREDKYFVQLQCQVSAWLLTELFDAMYSITQKETQLFLLFIALW